MEMIVYVVLFVGGFWYFAMLRGRKAVRAFIFLSAIDEGQSESDANMTASRIDLFAASKLQDQMKAFVNACFDGSQLTMISKARLAGFAE